MKHAGGRQESYTGVTGMRKKLVYALSIVLLLLGLNASGLLPGCKNVFADDYDVLVNKFITDSQWKNKTYYGESQYPKSYNSTLCKSCYAYTADFAHEVWPVTSTTNDYRPHKVGIAFNDINEIRAGDVLHVTGHYLVVLGRNGNSLWTIEGNAYDRRTGANHVVVESTTDWTIASPMWEVKLKKGGSQKKYFIEGWHMPGPAIVPKPKFSWDEFTVDQITESSAKFHYRCNTTNLSPGMIQKIGFVAVSSSGGKQTWLDNQLPSGKAQYFYDDKTNSQMGITFSPGETYTCYFYVEYKGMDKPSCSKQVTFTMKGKVWQIGRAHV